MSTSQVSPINVIREWNDFNAQYQELSWKNFVITRRLSNIAPPSAEFLPSKITQDGRTIWQFNKDDPATMAFLREYGDEPVLAFSTKIALLDVLFVADITLIMTVQVKGKSVKIPARPLTELAICKRDLADDLVRDPLFSNQEVLALKAYDQVLNEVVAREAQERRLAKIKEKEQSRELDIAMHDAKVKRILSRQDINCFTVDFGQPRHGRPVVGNEWECLKNNTFCILVESYDNTTGAYGKLIESFRVRKGGSKVSKQNVEAVQTTRVENAVTGDIEAEDVDMFTINGQAMLVPIYVGVKPSLVRTGTPFAIRNDHADVIYRRNDKDVLETLGTVRRQAQAA
ncbi:MAG: hypothetical protein ACAH17_03205 [Candidatus Paceibacterota bacterium]